MAWNFHLIVATSAGIKSLEQDGNLMFHIIKIDSFHFLA